jgi:NADH-quinone oxidoreductase subunit N
MFETLTQIDWFTLVKLASPLLVLLAASAVVIAGGALAEDGDSTSPVVALVGLGLAFVMAWRLWPTAPGTAVLALSFDRLSVASQMTVILSAVFVVMLSIPYLRAQGQMRAEYSGLLLLSVLGMGVLVSAGDLIVVLLGLEIMSLTVYALTGYLRRQRESVEAALKYFITGAFATAFFVMGLAFLFGSVGTTDLQLLAQRAPEVAAGPGRAFLLFGVAMVVVGFGFKVAAVPFHTWVPDAYQGAPTPITAFMATGVKVAAFIALARFALAVAGSLGDLWSHVFRGLALITIVVGNLAAIRQDNIKRMLAYSGIAHAGYILIIFPTFIHGDPASLRAVLLYLIAYGLTIIGAFSAVVAIGLETPTAVDMSRLSGLARTRPILAAALALFLLSLAGFPPTLGFFGKYYLFMEALRQGEVFLVVVGVLGTLVSIYYYLRPIVAMYFRETGGLPRQVLHPLILAVLIVAAMAVIAFGILPQGLVALVTASVS